MLGLNIAKRGMSSGKTYIGLGIFILAINIIIPLQAGAGAYVVFQSLSILGIVGLVGAIPVMLIYVHDRENGTLEYLLSMGMNQMDIFRGYLIASLVIGGSLLLVGAAGVTGVALYLELLNTSVLTTLSLSVIIGLSVVCLVTVLMMSYAALQRQPVGMNQPIGIAVGALLVLGFMFIPSAFPAYASTAQLVAAVLIVAVSMFFIYMAPRLIKREKMLP